MQAAGQPGLFTPPPADICRRKHGGNPESEAANRAVQESKDTTRRKIMELAEARGREGITADEVAAFWNVTHNHVAPRISELKKAKRLIPSTRRRETRTGCWARVVVAWRFAE